MAALANRHFSSLKEAETAVYALAEECGFAAVICRRNNKDPTTGEYWRNDVKCSRGMVTARKGTGQEQTPIARCGCEWKAVIKHLKNQPWTVELVNDYHNHSILAGEKLPFNRRRQRGMDDVAEHMEALSRASKLTSTDITRRMREDFPGTSISAKDVQNARYQGRREALGGRTPKEKQFFIELRDGSSSLISKHRWTRNAFEIYILEFPVVSREVVRILGDLIYR